MKRVNVIGTSASPKRRNLESVDRISFLPDSILGIILSFIPTKNAVSTSVLSKRWKLVWTLIHNLDLCYEDRKGEQDEREDMRFVGFVDRVLLHHDAGWLNKLRLVWTPRCISSHATSWIDAAISKNVHELSLRLETHTLVKTRYFYSPRRTSPVPFVIPISVFTCDSLRILNFNGGISVPESIAVCLPKLETIMLESIYFQSEEAFEKLIRGCPMLINLHMFMPDDMLYEFYQDDDFTYIVASTSLRRFEVDSQYPGDSTLYINFELDAPSLEYLSLYGCMPVFHVQKNLSSLVEAKLDLGSDFDYSDVHKCNSIVEAVRAFDCAKALNLSVHVIWALSSASIRLSTEFKRLVKLEVETYSCACSSLRDFLECSNNLEVLSVYQYDSFGEIEFDPSKWIAPVQVPRCLANSLKNVKFENYYGRENEREIVRYMLKHGKVLKDMEISFCSRFDNTKLNLVQEICKLSKRLSNKVPACEIKFAGETSKCNIKML